MSSAGLSFCCLMFDCGNKRSVLFEPLTGRKSVVLHLYVCRTKEKLHFSIVRFYNSVNNVTLNCLTFLKFSLL